jgi:hypothetical protein
MASAGPAAGRGATTATAPAGSGWHSRVQNVSRRMEPARAYDALYGIHGALIRGFRVADTTSRARRAGTACGGAFGSHRYGAFTLQYLALRTWGPWATPRARRTGGNVRCAGRGAYDVLG